MLRPSESRVVAGVRRALIAVACAYAVLAAWGMYRRIFQVLRVDISAPASLVDGSAVSIDVIATGEVRNRIVLELVQGERRETLIDTLSRLSASNTIDPRLFRYTP